MADTMLEEEVHARALRASTSEIAAYLQGLLGQRLTALLAGSRDPKAVGEWARGERTPHPTAARRLRDGFYVASLLMSTQAPETVRSWFVGMNPHLDDRAPALLLADDQPVPVVRAARAFLAGAW